MWVVLDSEPTGGYTHPTPVGRAQRYGHLLLGDGPDPRVQFMLDELDDRTLVHFDRNGNAT